MRSLANFVLLLLLATISQYSSGQAPQVIVSEPLNYSVARPMIHFKARAISSTDSCLLRIYISTTIIGTFLDSADTYLDLSPYEGKSITMYVQATDKNNQTDTSGPITLYVESSHYLQEYFAAPGRIQDFNYNKVLVVGDGPLPDPRIIDLTNGTSISIPYNGNIDKGYLTPMGAIISAISTTDDSLFEFNNGSLYPLGIYNPGSMKVAGNYCIWVRRNNIPNNPMDSLFYRDLTAGTSTLIASNTPHTVLGITTTSDVTKNGTVVYADSTQNIIKYSNSHFTAITSDGSPGVTIGYANPLTDDHNIAYQQKDGPSIMAFVTGEQGAARLYDGLRGPIPVPGGYYQVNNKYVASINIPIINHPPDSPLYTEIMLRDTLGRSFLIQHTTGFPVDKLDLLNPKGDLMLISSVRKLAAFNKPLLSICSSLGKTYYYDSTWYIAIGRILFKVILNPSPTQIKNSSLTIGEDSAYQFKATDFTDNFSGPGQLVSVQFMALPRNGELDLAGIPVSVSDKIARADLASLRYTPHPGFRLTDTLGWKAYDGISFTSAALVIINIIGFPASPHLAGLDTVYCAYQGLQKIKISDLPAAVSGTAVIVKLDNTELNVSETDSSFSFEPGILSVGMHTIITKFTNIAGAALDTQYFSILVAVTPSVKVSADITNVNNLEKSVTITAENILGGGNNPEFIFARDRNFTDILQALSNNNKLTISSNNLVFGENWLYVRMNTSEHCYTVQTDVDSIDIKRTNVAGIIDPDFPGQPINANPNPFKNSITVNGLNNSKSYMISLYQVNGQVIFSRQVMNQVTFDLFSSNITRGVYLLRIYDQKKGKLLGSLKLIKE